MLRLSMQDKPHPESNHESSPRTVQGNVELTHGINNVLPMCREAFGQTEQVPNLQYS